LCGALPDRGGGRVDLRQAVLAVLYGHRDATPGALIEDLLLQGRTRAVPQQRGGLVRREVDRRDVATRVDAGLADDPADVRLQIVLVVQEADAHLLNE